MKTLAEQVCELPEIELQEFVEGISEHIHRNKLNHLFNSIAGKNDEVDDLEEELEGAERRINNLEDERDNYEGTIDSIKNIMPTEFKFFTEEDFKAIQKFLK